MKRPKPALLVLAVSSVLLTGCTWPWSSPHQSAPDPTGAPGTHAAVIQEPQGFRNVSFSCFGTDGVFVTSRGVATTPGDLPSSVFVVPNDPHCTR